MTMDSTPGFKYQGLNASIAAVLEEHEDDPFEVERVAFRDPKQQLPLTVEPYNPAWPFHFQEIRARIVAAIGTTALFIAHVGSTSIPGIAAKPVIDIDMVVKDVEDEASYVPALEAVGFQFLFRQPKWHAHRFLVGNQPISCNLHVFGKQCPEVEKHRIFRDYLLGCDEDRELYARTKLQAVAASIREGENVQGYNGRKEKVILQILKRAFQSLGYLPDDDVKATTTGDTDLAKLARKLGTEGPFRTMPTPRMVKALFGGVYVFRTTKAVFVWEHRFYPHFYIPKSAITQSEGVTLETGESILDVGGKVIAHQCTLKAGSKSTQRVIAFSDDLSGAAEPLKGLIKIEFPAMDMWFEEDTPIGNKAHPKDPFVRVEILQSERHIKVSIEGTVIAETNTAMHLYETNLPARYYMPLSAIDPKILRPSKTTSHCPYKGDSQYYHVEINGKIFQDIFWYYTNPTLESARIAGLVCPYNEKVDIELDGKKMTRPKTHFV
ncbi:Hypothetical protein R9X50_00670800 [Acrodontium crateriforme]|uniref:DUF427 domain-containing protein n=1 Tax=Acrodontium crateriforme TaxID=150365 RepID=A0AAQ3RCB1_9PEZI|nr:Hypothetical protein R9X50_00670800 [Acrodontium crateriforme]